jgi:squalene-associated FAD-dependent desaturase
MTEPGVVHIIGAGLAGLAASVALTQQGRAVVIYEATQHAGGRCRSFFDAELGCRIDNGNHLVLTGNSAVLSYVETIGALDSFDGPADAVIPFVDLATGERWSLRPNNGRLPWWIFSTGRRVPDTRARDYLAALKLRHAENDATVADALDANTVLFRRLWQPLAVAALNTSAEQASARLFGHLLAETLGRGASACRPLVPREGLSESLIDPALDWLAERGAEIRFGSRLRAFTFATDLVSELVLDQNTIPLSSTDAVILAVTAPVAVRLLPGLTVPEDHAPIVNAHFHVLPPPTAPLFLGVVGGIAEWIFRKPDVVSVTVSAADNLIDWSIDELRERLWSDVVRAYGLTPQPIPPARIVKERRATFRATPDQLKRRPPAATSWANLRVAGDYVDTGLPATIEGAIRSGFAAAAGLERRSDRTSVTQPRNCVLERPFIRRKDQSCQRVLP